MVSDGYRVKRLAEFFYCMTLSALSRLMLIMDILNNLGILDKNHIVTADI